MAYQTTEYGGILPQNISDTSAVQKAPLGTITRAKDPVFGAAEFIYLKGVASTVVGDLVTYDQYAGTTKRGVAGDRGLVAVAMSANVAEQYGWYLITGAALVRSAAGVVVGAPVYLTATAGQVDDAVVATDKVDGARFRTVTGTPTAGFTVVQMSRPALNGNG
ncbi:virion structural protein [Myxococcus phage Mx8]|uniref:Major virion structural protein n=1 Tax=Myxococcus phage Mx8 TaxID=49964 RepID=Q94MS0_9CAUD|nr:virion structural protein [Myxococcus phage Mx8]AAK94384.1 major virion structural protein [Myxococcus phage Mx8]